MIENKMKLILKNLKDCLKNIKEDLNPTSAN